MSNLKAIAGDPDLTSKIKKHLDFHKSRCQNTKHKNLTKIER